VVPSGKSQQIKNHNMKPFDIHNYKTVHTFHDFSNHHCDDTWVLSLSDLMSLLLIFFLVWTTLKMAHLKREEATPSTTPQMSFASNEKQFEGLKDTLLEFSPVETPNGSIMIVLAQDISFDPSSTSLSPQGIDIIKRIAKKLKGGTHYRIRVLGHTDDLPVAAKGKWASNFDLSLHRAAAVASQLITDGIPAGRIICQGFGALYPARSMEHQSQRRFNRRVELIIEPA